MTTYVLGGGCFWCLDGVYRQLKGVTDVESGYAGGDGPAGYWEVVSGHTGHAEVARVTFDETIIPSDVILDCFFSFTTQQASTGKAPMKALSTDQQ